MPNFNKQVPYWVVPMWVVHYTHEHGEDYWVFASAEGAERQRQKMAHESWFLEMPGDRPRPEDPVQMANEYFDYMGERSEEFIVITKCNVLDYPT